MQRTKFVAALAAMACWAGAAHAEGFQAQCGRETGTGYAVPGGVISASDAGWYEDSMDGETVVRVDTDTGEVDVRFLDATGLWQTPQDSGGSTLLVGAQAEPWVVMVAVAYPGRTVEVLTVAMIADGGRARLIHTVSRMTDLMTNSRVMTADCVVSAY